jgi:DNA polymerase-1
MQRELRNKELVCAEGKFEIAMARKVDVDLEAQGNSIYEIQYAAALLSDQRRSFALEDLAHDYLGESKLEIDRTKIWELPASEVGPYGEQDAGLTLRTGNVLRDEIQKQGLTRVLKLENDLIWSTCEMERNGVPLDVPKMLSWSAELQRRFQKTIRRVYEETGHKINPNSANDLAKLFDKLQLPYGYTEKGAPSFTNEFMSGVDNELIQEVRYAIALDSLDSKYTRKYAKAVRDGLLRYRLHQLKSDEYGTISGRYSSSSVNIQQVFDKKRQAEKLGVTEYIIRELFLPRPGRLWVKADAAQIEYRLFVHYSKSKRLIQRYIDDPLVDFHVEVQRMIETIRPITRQHAKGINFAKLYGSGIPKLARVLGVSEDEAAALVALYDEAFPEARELMNLAMRLARQRGFVKTILGRVARFPEAQRLHSALNRVIQGTAADIMKLKLLEVYNNRKLLDLHMFFTVHDEVDGDVGSEAAAIRLKELLDEPITELGLRVPIVWETGTGTNWAAAA